MRDRRLIMGMPIEVEVVSDTDSPALESVFSYFTAVDERLSTYKPESEIMRINRNEIPEDAWSSEMKEIFSLAQKTKEETRGYFNIMQPSGMIDPSGIVKGWAIQNAAQLLKNMGIKNFFIDAGGDIQTSGTDASNKRWSVGIRNPFNEVQIVKVLYPQGKGIATSGSYARGEHIYNPHKPEQKLHEIISLTVIGPNVLEADRFATGAFAMGKNGISFIEELEGFEGYSIDHQGIATMTSGFEIYTL